MINKVQVVIESLPQRKKKIKTERIKEIIYQLLCCICSLPSSTKKQKHIALFWPIKKKDYELFVKKEKKEHLFCSLFE